MSTRREFLATHLPALTLALPLIKDAQPITFALSAESERAAAIDEWLAILTATQAPLQQLIGFLLSAKAKPPEAVDHKELFKLFDALFPAVDNLLEPLNAAKFEEFFEQTTGHSHWHVCLERDIYRDPLDVTYMTREIDAVGEYNPTVAARLRALLNERVGR